MKYSKLILAAAVSAACFATSAQAAQSDYFLKIDTVEGESSAPIEVASWSFGASNPSLSAPRDAASGMASGKRADVVSPRDPASGQATGKRMHKPFRMDTSSSDASAGAGAKVSVSDLSVMRSTDLMAVSAQDSIEGFSLTFDKASPVLAKVCGGKHFPKATLSGRSGDFELQDITVTSCTVPKQTQGATFGERCVSGGECPATGVTVSMTGQMKHTKTGHVTLLK